MADAELQESNNPTLRRVRKLFENLRSLSGPLSLPTLDRVPTNSDPIFALIEARRRAYANYEKAGGAPARRPGKNQQARICIGDYASVIIPTLKTGGGCRKLMRAPVHNHETFRERGVNRSEQIVPERSRLSRRRVKIDCMC